MSVVLIILACGILVPLLALVLVPFQVVGEGRVWADGVQGQAEIRWAWGLVRVPVRPGRREAKEPAKKRRQAEKKKPSSGATSRLWQHRRTVLRLVRRAWGSLRVRGHIEGHLGLGDPADTAVLFEVLRALERPSLALAIRPSWIDEAVDLRGTVHARVWVGHLVVVGLTAVIGDLFRRS